jgi:hypothetical protein
MRRRILTTTIITLTAALFLGAQPALAAFASEKLPALQRLDLSAFCDGNPTVLDQRDDRTLTTLSDRSGRVVLQSLTTATTDLFTRADGAVMDLQEHSLVTVKPNPRGGDATILWVGRGAIWGDDEHAGGPFLLWVTGIVVMRGSYDPKTGTFALTSKAILGQSTDLCVSIETGLKPRH